MKQILLRFGLTLLLGLALSACGKDAPEPAVAPPSTPGPASNQSGEDSTSGEPAPTPDPDLVRVGIYADSAPFVEKVGDEFVGFDIDLMNAIVQQAGLKVQYVEEKDFYSIFNNLADNNFKAYEIAISGITITPERKALVAFSDPYFRTGQAILVNQGSGIAGPSDLTDSLVGVHEGTTGAIWCRQESQATCTNFPSISQAVQSLVEGKVEAVVHDYAVAVNFVKENPQLTLLDGFVSDELYGVVVPQHRPDLLATINAGLAAVLTSGQYEQICQQWIEGAEQCLLPTSSAEELETAEPAAANLQESPETPLPATEKVETTSPQVELPPTEEAVVEAAEIEATFPILPCEIAAVVSTAAGQAYQIQPGDWLSTIAERAYGNPLDYRAIVAYNNRQCQLDSTFTCIANPDQIEVGWTLYLPTGPEVDSYWADQLVSLPPIDWSTDGAINIAGSSTVFPLTRQIKICFQESGFGGPINLESTGTLNGFEQFCQGQIEVVNASVPMSQAYRQLCRQNGLEPVEFQIGTDAVVVVVNHQNDFVETVTSDELRQLLSTAALWSDVNPSWPAAPVKRFYPTRQSGTFESLAKILFPDQPERLAMAPNIILQTEDDQALVQEIQSDPLAIGFFGYAYYANNQDRLRTLPVQGIKPLPETVDQSRYPLVRPLFIYTAAETMQQKPQVVAFINYYLTSVKNYITDVGYFLPSEETLKGSIQTLNRVTQGSP